jgi:hypothetical protein
MGWINETLAWNNETPGEKDRSRAMVPYMSQRGQFWPRTFVNAACRGLARACAARQETSLIADGATIRLFAKRHPQGEFNAQARVISL